MPTPTPEPADLRQHDKPAPVLDYFETRCPIYLDNAEQERSRAIVAMMDARHISCGNHGGHGGPRHHHHDMVCLVEAGLNQARPALLKAEEKIAAAAELHEHLMDRLFRQGEMLGSLREEKDRAHNSAERKAERIADLMEFMGSMPGPGPWKTVLEAWQHHVMEVADAADS